MSIDGPDDLAGLRRIGTAVARARDAMLAEVRPGISTAELDEVGRDVLKAHGARSAPQLAYGFPGWTCISVNADLAHGIPSPDKLLHAGDLYLGTCAGFQYALTHVTARCAHIEKPRMLSHAGRS